MSNATLSKVAKFCDLVRVEVVDLQTLADGLRNALPSITELSLSAGVGVFDGGLKSIGRLVNDYQASFPVEAKSWRQEEADSLVQQ